MKFRTILGTAALTVASLVGTPAVASSVQGVNFPGGTASVTTNFTQNFNSTTQTLSGSGSLAAGFFDKTISYTFGGFMLVGSKTVTLLPTLKIEQLFFLGGSLTANAPGATGTPFIMATARDYSTMLNGTMTNYDLYFEVTSKRSNSSNPFNITGIAGFANFDIDMLNSAAGSRLNTNEALIPSPDTGELINGGDFSLQSNANTPINQTSPFTGGGTGNVVFTAVPEPATLALFGLGLLGAGAARRRSLRAAV